MTSKNKLISTGIFVALALLLFSSTVLAQGTVDFDPPITAKSLTELVQNFLTYLRGIIVLLAIVFIVLGGIWYMTGTGEEKQVERAKMIVTAAVIGLAIALAAPALLDEILYIVNGTSGSSGLYEMVNRTLLFLLSVVGILAIVMLVVGGIYYMTSAGDEEWIEKGKKIVTYAVIGIAVALLGLAIVKAVAYIVTGTAG